MLYQLFKCENNIELYLQVKVYQALPPSKTKRKRKKRLLETRRLSVHSTGWEIFSVKVAVSDWIIDSNKNLGKYLSFFKVMKMKFLMASVGIIRVWELHDRNIKISQVLQNLIALNEMILSCIKN